MSQRRWNIDLGPIRGFYRDRESGWVFGVCAGLADRFNLNLGAVRVIAVISLLLFRYSVTTLAQNTIATMQTTKNKLFINAPIPETRGQADSETR